MTIPFRVDEENSQAWIAVPHSARINRRAMYLIGDPQPSSNFGAAGELYPFEKVSDRARAYFMAVARIIRRYRKEIRSLWRRLDSGQQALLVLAYLKKGETYPQVAAWLGVGTATAWRYVNETVDLLAARAPRLRTSARDARKAGHAYVIVDGTLIAIDRMARDKPFYSGKHVCHERWRSPD